MPSSGMLCRVGHVRIDVSGERIPSLIRVTRIGELGTTTAKGGNETKLIQSRNPRHQITIGKRP
jgi:hypothetical protein